MGMTKQVVLNEEDFASYKATDDCFGHKEMGYNPDTDECKECEDENGKDFVNKCQLLCKGAEGILEGEFEEEEPTTKEEPEEPEEPEEDDTNEVGREWMLMAVQNKLIERNIYHEVVSTATRDKVHLGDEVVFVITKRGLKVNKQLSGSDLGLEDDQWKEDNKGITIVYDATINYGFLLWEILDRIVGVGQAEEDAPQAAAQDIFDGVEKAPEPEEKPKPKPKVLKKDETVTDAIVAPETPYTGEVTKEVQMTKYSNGYTRIAITVKSENASGLIAKLKEDFA